MSASLRTLSVAAFLVAYVALFAVTTEAADLVGKPSSSAKVLPSATCAAHWRARNWRWGGRHYRWAAPSMLVAGVRGATPLTVPFFGSNWYPGPVYYYGPPLGPYICDREDPVISVRY
jgi:hypothetical protein